MTTIKSPETATLLHLRPEFIQQLQSRNRKTFADLYDAYSPGLYGIIRRILGTENGADDILQNSFIKIWINIETYCPGRATFFTWMLTITRNETIDYLRSKHAKNSNITMPVHEESMADYKTDHTDILRMDYHQSLRRIPGKERVILQLYITGFTCREIGCLLSVPEGTVKTRMRAIYKKLRLLHA